MPVLLVSLVGFQFSNVELKGVKVPFHSNFEQIGLQFYVRRFVGTEWQKGIVFISEIADKPLLSLLANKVFHENFSTLPTTSEFTEDNLFQHIKYAWKFKDEWQYFQISSEKLSVLIAKDSLEEFVLERPFIYGKYKKDKTISYDISHIRWRIFPTHKHQLKSDFSMEFGSEFSHLTKIHSVVFADGSPVSMEMKNNI